MSESVTESPKRVGRDDRVTASHERTDERTDVPSSHSPAATILQFRNARTRVPAHSSPETADAVLLLLRMSANAQHEVAVASRVIAECLGIGDTTAKNALHRLLDDERIACVRKGTGNLTSSTYRITTKGRL